MKILLMVAALAGLASCGSGTSQEEASPKDSQMVAEHVDPSTKFPAEVVQADTLQTDISFAGDAVRSGEELAGLAMLAVEKASTTTVKELAQKIAADQQNLQNEARQVKQRSTDTANHYTDNSRAELEKLSGAAFDKQWVEKMTLKYTALISRYENEREAAKNKSVKEFVRKQIPILKDHQQQLEACRAKLK